MIKCEECLYRKNCQFLASHKKTAVEGCTAFKSESDLKSEAIKEFAERLKKNEGRRGVPIGTIDNLLAEMVGGEDDTN